MIHGRDVDISCPREIHVEIPDVDLTGLTAPALFELRREFSSMARKCRRAFSRYKKMLRPGVEQIEAQLSKENERRQRSESGSGAPLLLIFQTIEEAGLLVAFLDGLRETYIAVRAKVAPQSEIEKKIADLKSAAFECSKFCRSVAAAIRETRLEV